MDLGPCWHRSGVVQFYKTEKKIEKNTPYSAPYAFSQMKDTYVFFRAYSPLPWNVHRTHHSFSLGIKIRKQKWTEKYHHRTHHPLLFLPKTKVASVRRRREEAFSRAHSFGKIRHLLPSRQKRVSTPNHPPAPAPDPGRVVGKVSPVGCGKNWISRRTRAEFKTPARRLRRRFNRIAARRKNNRRRGTTPYEQSDLANSLR